MLVDTKQEREALFAVTTTATAHAQRPPRTAQETGLPFFFLVELITKILFQRGVLRLVELSSHIKLGCSVIEPLIAFMRSEKLCEVSRTGGSGTDADLTYKLTDLGRNRAGELIALNAYAGPAPVAIKDYYAEVKARSVAGLDISRSAVEAEYGNIVVNPRVLERLGAAMNSNRAMFIHGPAGSGKTYLAERLSGLLKGSISVPYALYVAGEIIQFYDPVMHQLVDSDDAGGTMRARNAQDARWLHVKRPAVVTGGELTLDMLDLKFDASTRFYQAPPHLKANNGIFIIDDLGRQRCSTTDLLNRWIVPMDRRVDYLSLHTGYKFEVPFDVILVFSSNMPPANLGDGSFLRRIGYKIQVGALTEAEYERVFSAACIQYGITFDPAAFQYLLHERHHPEQRPLLACYPRDILSQLHDVAVYEERNPVLDPESLDWAWKNYFAEAE